MRHSDVHWVIETVAAKRCVEILGFSNVGKSSLLRLLSQPDVWLQELGEASRNFRPIYIDCNSMLEMTDQGFYEVVLRSLPESYPAHTEQSEVRNAYEMLVNPASEFQVPLSFNRALSAVLERSDQTLVLLLDEFDEPISRIDSRVFLNLRATQDRFRDRLVYVTATGRPLTAIRQDDSCGEFCELFAYQSWHLAPLVHSDVERFVSLFGEERGIPYSAADGDFVYRWTGGHPVMQTEVCRLLAHQITVMDVPANPAGAILPEEQRSDAGLDRYAQRRVVHRAVLEQMRASATLQDECAKIWLECSSEEQSALVALTKSKPKADPTTVAQLERRHILRRVEGTVQLFCRLLAGYIQNRQSGRDARNGQLWVDVESGAVLVDGEAVDLLTNLEYRLMVLLFQNAEKIVDKYQIVTAVWGEAYIDSVDDARIEKLISRLRQKVEPDPGQPRFLTTVRGRGYQLFLEPVP